MFPQIWDETYALGYTIQNLNKWVSLGQNIWFNSHRAGGLHPGLAIDLHGQPSGRPVKREQRDEQEGWGDGREREREREGGVGGYEGQITHTSEAREALFTLSQDRAKHCTLCSHETHSQTGPHSLNSQIHCIHIHTHSHTQSWFKTFMHASPARETQYGRMTGMNALLILV